MSADDPMYRYTVALAPMPTPRVDGRYEPSLRLLDGDTREELAAVPVAEAVEVLLRHFAPHRLPEPPPVRPTDAQIDDRVGLWHATPGDAPLWDALGWSKAEYAAFVEDGNAVPARPLPPWPPAENPA